MKKFISFCALLSLLITTNFWFYQTFAVDTNQQNTPWTMQKARHLAKKALMWATLNDIQNIYDIWSAQSAVNYLFPSRNGPNRSDYETKLSELTQDPDFDANNRNDMYEYYLAKKLYDPYEAKAKLFLMFEDIFSVNVSGSKNITYLDIENTHDLLYREMFWDYKTLVKKSLYDINSQWDYSVSQFLDLFNQSNPARPNENYARELLQLLLMWEYLPFESADIQSTRNYEETDVAALAKILVWFETNENTHEVTYNNQANTNEKIVFLEWDFQNSYTPNYYNQETWEIDIQLLKTPIAMNNWLADNIIDYIFAKKQNEISQFLAKKLYNFYVWENPLVTEINDISQVLLQNNFDIYTTTKWLLSNDMMYSQRSMNEIIYKTPVDLVVGTKKILWVDNLSTFRHSLSNLWWRPYMPGSIFGRDGYDENKEFFNATSVIKWSYEASKIVDEIDTSTFIDSNLNLEENIAEIEQKLLWEEILSNSTREQLMEFMLQDNEWNPIEFQPESQEYNRYYTASLLYFILSQPEYILLSWVDTPSDIDNQRSQFYWNDNKLVIIKYRGWLDWLHGVIQKDEYNQYLENRDSWALQRNELVEVWDYYLNSKMSDFKSLYDSWDLKIFNRVGTPSHSRAHDTASRKMTSAYSQWNLEAPWILWEFIKNEDPLKTVQLWWDKWLVFRWGQYLQIWNDGLFRVDDSTNNDFRIHKLTTLKKIYNQRNYPEKLDFVFKNGAYIWNVAETSVANGWRSWAWYNMWDNLSFTETLFDAWITNVVRIAADGWYDTHWNQKENLSNNLEKVAQKTTEFFNNVKDKHNVTIVLYSEFWRTLKINSSQWTDHWKWGWMFILSNNQQWKTQLPNKVYGNNSFINAQANRLWVWIDYRSVYKKIYETLYNKDISETLGWNYDINTYLNDQNPDPKLFRIEYQREWSRLRAYLKFSIDDENYFHTQWSHIRFSYWSDVSNLRNQSRYTIDRYMVEDDKNLNLYMRNLSENREYHYKIEIFDNQYNSRVIESSFTTPEYKSGQDTLLELNKNTFLSQYNNTNINNTLVLENPIFLSSTGSNIYFADDNIQLEAQWETIIQTLTSQSWWVWNGWFMLPKEINKDDFIINSSHLDDTKLTDIKNIEKIIHVWSDVLWVSMNISKSVDLKVNWINSNTQYWVIHSTNWIDWSKVEQWNISQANNQLIIKTQHFSYFAIVELDNNWEIIINNTDNDNSQWNNNPWNSSGWWSSGSHVPNKDNCPYGDYSKSYYDRTCWKDYTAKQIYKLANSYEVKNNLSYNIENDQINNALEELEIYDGWKFDIFNEIFPEIDVTNTDQKNLLKFLRQDVTTMKVLDYDIYYIQNSTRNKSFKSIAQILTQQGYKDEFEDKLIDSFNSLWLTIAIKQNIELTNATQSTIKRLLAEKINSFKFHYNTAQRNKKTYNYIIPKSVQNTQDSQKTPAYYRTRKEEIIKKHKQK